MQGQVLLGCITNELETALKVAAILSRSHVGVRLNTGIPDSVGSQDQPAPFQIILLPQLLSQIRPALQWLMQHDTLRYIYAYHTPLDSQTCVPVSVIANEILDTLDQAHTLTAVHLLSQSDIKLLESNLEQSVVLHESKSLGDDMAGIQQTLNALPSDHSTQVLTAFSEEQDLLGLTRGTESARLLCGNPLVTTHLPALLRMRGWLHSAHQVLPLCAPVGHQIVFCSNHNTPDQHQKDHYASLTQTIFIDSNRILSAEVQTELHNQLIDTLALNTITPALRPGTQAASTIRVLIQLEYGDDNQTNQKAEAIVAKLLTLSVNIGARQFLVFGQSLATALMDALGIEHYNASDELATGIAWLHGTAHTHNSDESTCAIALAVVIDRMKQPEFLNNAFDALCNPGRQTDI